MRTEIELRPEFMMYKMHEVLKESQKAGFLCSLTPREKFQTLHENFTGMSKRYLVID